MGHLTSNTSTCSFAWLSSLTLMLILWHLCPQDMAHIRLLSFIPEKVLLGPPTSNLVDQLLIKLLSQLGGLIFLQLDIDSRGF
jgi:hypothetical protein